jgi:hypothetical protein
VLAGATLGVPRSGVDDGEDARRAVAGGAPGGAVLLGGAVVALEGVELAAEGTTGAAAELPIVLGMFSAERLAEPASVDAVAAAWLGPLVLVRKTPMPAAPASSATPPTIAAPAPARRPPGLGEGDAARVAASVRA